MAGEYKRYGMGTDFKIAEEKFCQLALPNLLMRDVRTGCLLNRKLEAFSSYHDAKAR